jgi:hypothetical protein
MGMTQESSEMSPIKI